MHLLKPDGSVQQLKLGDPIQDPDAFPQVNIPVGVWAATELEDKFSYCFLSQIQAPGISKLNIFGHSWFHTAVLNLLFFIISYGLDSLESD